MLSFIHKNATKLAWLLLILLLSMSLTLPLLYKNSQINTSILALLPDNPEKDLPEQLQQLLMTQLDKQLVWLVSPSENSTTAAKAWLSVLENLPQLNKVRGPLDSQEQALWFQYTREHTPALLDAQTLNRLEQGGENYARWVLSQVYSPFAGVSQRELQEDPLLLLRSLHSANLAEQKFELQDNWPLVKDETGKAWFLIQAELNISSYDIQQAQDLTNQLAKAKSEWLANWPNGELLERGTLFYASYASEQAQSDMRVLGSLTLLGVVLLILITFRSSMPLLLSFLSIIAGVISGIWAVLLLFGELHLMMLVMSISVIGVTVDYVLYFLVERRVHGAERSIQQSLAVTFPTLSSALLTTLAAYLVLALPPMPVFRQLAVFSVVGMLTAFLVVLLWLPLLSKGLKVRPLPAVTLLQAWLNFWQKPWVRLLVPTLVFGLALLGIAKIKISDDPTDFQSLPSTIQQQEQRLTQLLGQASDQTWLLVFADQPQAALEKLEKIEPLLKQAVGQGYLTAYQRLPLVSLKQQQQHLALLESVQPLVKEKLQLAGLLQESSPLKNTWQPLTPMQWQLSPAGRIWGSLLLSTDNNLTGILLPLQGVTNNAALENLFAKNAGVVLMDRRSAYTRIFAEYRQLLSWLLLLALALIAVNFFFKLGFKAGLRTLTPTLVSLLAAPAALGLFGHSFNLFALLAMTLVLGVGINYTLFFSNPRGTPTTALFANFLAASTTLLTLGILVFSSTQVISSFGLVLGSGLLTAFLLSPLAAPPLIEGISKS